MDCYLHRIKLSKNINRICIFLLFFCYGNLVYANIDSIIDFDVGEEVEDVNESSVFDKIKDTALESKNVFDLLENCDSKNAKFIIINKITAKSKLLSIPINKQSQFGNILITPYKCTKKYSSHFLDNLALIDITNIDKKLLFQGWISSSNIVVSVFIHPVYNVFLLSCD